ncbi:uncharacterized protein LOC143293567 [Babylonia areolata]|uniref:uncharacterized protein LOC143293567 n=1 Tax=Babylonia areolata TaxID=304850 RepID=UPI003FD2C7CD
MAVFIAMVNGTMVTFNDVNYSADIFEIPESEKTMGDIATAIRFHYLIVVCAVGLPGNMAAILTIATVRPVSTATFLVALLAVSDSAALVVKLIINQLWLRPDLPNDDFCRTFAVTNVFSSYANWVLVLIGFERLVAVMFPMVRHRFLSKRRVYLVCVLLALAISSIHAPVMAGREARDWHCEPTEAVRHYIQHVWPLLTTLVYALVPQVLLVFITTALFLALRKAGLRREQLMGSSAHVGPGSIHRELRRSERAITSMTIAASLLFVLMVLPQCVYAMLYSYSRDFQAIIATRKEQLLKQIVFLLADSTHALNFYLYFLSVRRFRTYFWKMVRCERPLCTRPAQSSITRSSKREGVVTNSVTEGGEGPKANGSEKVK